MTEFQIKWDAAAKKPAGPIQSELALDDRRKTLRTYKGRKFMKLRVHQKKGMKLSTPQLVWGLTKQPKWVSTMMVNGIAERK